MKSKTFFTQVANVLDRDSYIWLQHNHPDLCDAVENSVAAGATPAELRRFVYGQTYRIEIAKRVEQAARHLASQTSAGGE